MFKNIIAVSLVTLLAGSAPAMATDGVVDIVAPFEITGLDPAKSGDIFLRMRIVETLVDADRDGNPVPALAKNWSVSEDGLTWRFELQTGVKFQDGTALTAEAVASALNIARAKAGLLSKAPITEIKADAEGAVVVSLSKPFVPLLAFLAENRAQILAPAAYEGADVKAIIGTGRFKLTKLEAPQSLAVERFADYRGEKPQIEKATYLS
ncbi:MAG: ABC transporter substrate-binding protein, partial [Allorhizobium sp.]